MIKKWINKNFKSLMILISLVLVVGMGFSIYSVLARTAGQISDPVGNWPSGGDLGYIGEPMDARLADSDLAGDESVYNLLGKIHEKAGGGVVTPPSPSICGTCSEWMNMAWGCYGPPLYNTQLSPRTDCCTTQTKLTPTGVPSCPGIPGGTVCAPPADGIMTLTDTVPRGDGTLSLTYSCYR